MRPRRTFAVLALVLGASVAAHAQEKKSSHPGYVDAAWTKALTDKPATVQVMLDPPLLKLVASASKESDQDLNAVISQLAFVRVHVYEDLSVDAEKLTKAVESQISTLDDKGWSTVARVREDDQRVDVLMKATDEKIVGFVVIVAGDDQLVFVNIAGDIEPEKFGEKLGGVVAKLSGGEIDLDIEGLTGSLGAGKGSSDDEKKDETATPDDEKKDETPKPKDDKSKDDL
jgi:hypothetical protein